jgi:hypothetical protein
MLATKKAVKYDARAVYEDIAYFKMRAATTRNKEARRKYLKQASMLADAIVIYKLT